MYVSLIPVSPSLSRSVITGKGLERREGGYNVDRERERERCIIHVQADWTIHNHTCRLLCTVL